MTGTLDPDCKGYVASPSVELHVKTRVNSSNEVYRTERLRWGAICLLPQKLAVKSLDAAQ